MKETKCIKCAACGENFMTDVSEEEALEEYLNSELYVPGETELYHVCHPCYLSAMKIFQNSTRH